MAPASGPGKAVTPPPPSLMGAFMRLAPPSFLLAAAFLAAPAAPAQSLVSEEVQGNRRLCNYSGEHGLLSGTRTGRQYQVGIAENCPVTLPVASGNRLAPPTAALSSDSPATDGRICVYEQWGNRWTFSLPGRTFCPPAAGMIPRPRTFTDPARPPAPGQ
jgi:hypothetical protein